MGRRKRAKLNQNTAIGYVRVSTSKQKDGLSIDSQRGIIKAYCSAHGLTLLDVLVDEGASAYKQPFERRGQGGKHAVEMLKSGQAGAVVAVRLDRLFRSIKDAIVTTIAWDNAGIALHLVDLGGQSLNTSTPMGRMMVAMLSGFAEMESYIKAERIRDVWTHRKSKGKRLGSLPPYGYQMDGQRPVPHPEERAIIAKILELRAAGTALRAIVETLEAEGHPPRGKRWHITTVHRILERHV